MRQTFAQVVSPKVGPPVDWNSCLGCGGLMEADEERYRIERNGVVGVGHDRCR